MLSLMFLQASDTDREIHSTQTCHCLLMTLHTKWLLEHCLFPCFRWLLFVSWHLICTSYVKTHSWNMTSIISFNLQDKPNSINSTILKCWWGMMARSSYSTLSSPHLLHKYHTVAFFKILCGFPFLKLTLDDNGHLLFISE